MVKIVHVTDRELLVKFKFPLYKYTLSLTGAGATEQQTREIYQRNDSVAIILYNLESQTVILTRQFRLPAFLTGYPDGQLTEACAGTMEDESAEEAIIRETEEETGYRIETPLKVAECFVSPGSCSEKINLFIAPYTEKMKVAVGGGLKEEGEDIEILEVPFKQLREQMKKGSIQDAKTLILLQYLEIHYFRLSTNQA